MNEDGLTIYKVTRNRRKPWVFLTESKDEVDALLAENLTWPEPQRETIKIQEAYSFMGWESYE